MAQLVDFIAGVLDGETQYLPEDVYEWRVALPPKLEMRSYSLEEVGMLGITYQVYRSIGHGMFMLYRTIHHA